MAEKGWLTKQFEHVENDVKKWPEWMLGSVDRRADRLQQRDHSKNMGETNTNSHSDESVDSGIG